MVTYNSIWFDNVHHLRGDVGLENGEPRSACVGVSCVQEQDILRLVPVFPHTVTKINCKDQGSQISSFYSQMSDSSESTKALVVQGVLTTASIAPPVSLNEASMHIIIMQDGQLIVICTDHRSGQDCILRDEAADERHEDPNVHPSSHT